MTISKTHKTVKDLPTAVRWIHETPHNRTYPSHDDQLIYFTGPTHRMSIPRTLLGELLRCIQHSPNREGFLYSLSEYGHHVWAESERRRPPVVVVHHLIGRDDLDQRIRNSLARKQQIQETLRMKYQLQQRGYSFPLKAEPYVAVDDGTAIPLCNIVDSEGLILAAQVVPLLADFIVTHMNAAFQPKGVSE